MYATCLGITSSDSKNISEMGLLAFIAKLFRNNFFDTTKKYQINYEKRDPTEVKLKEVHSKEEKVVIENKDI